MKNYKLNIFKSMVVLLALVGGTTFAQDVTGTWKGTLNIQGTDLPLVIHISEEDGALKSQLDSPAQEAYGIKNDKTTFEDGTLKFSNQTIQASYEGELQGEVINGTFSQSGYNFPLSLERGAMDEDIEILYEDEIIDEYVEVEPMPEDEEVEVEEMDKEAEKAAEKAEKDREKAEKELEKAQKEREKAAKEIEKAQEEAEKEVEKALKDAEKERKEAEKERKKAEKERKKAEKERKKAEKAVKKAEQAEKKLRNAEEKLEKDRAKFERLEAAGELSPNDIAKWNTKLDKQQLKINKLQRKFEQLERKLN